MKFSLALLAFAIVLGCGALSAAEPEGDAISLFNGKDLNNWLFVLADHTSPSKVWSVRDGMIVCQGNPKGYLRSVDEYENYALSLEYRWAPGSQGGNSGVLVHATTPGAIGVWPKSLEAQLAADNAGDFWVIGVTIDLPNPEGRIMGRRHLNLTDGSENPPGEWNRYEVICDGDEVTVLVNGEKVNYCRNVSQTKGAICLQSEGAEVHFRNIELRPLTSASKQ